jgi:methyltransferase
MTVIAVFVVVYASMAVEALRASRNERVQRSRGGVEAPGDVYAVMRIAYPGLFLGLLAEGAVRGDPPLGVIVGGGLVFAAAKALKWWAIRSLGPSWTFRVIVVPGVPLVSRGPYRYFRHPNYLAVLGEFLGVGLMTGARILGPVAIVIFGALILKRVAIENRALG